MKRAMVDTTLILLSSLVAVGLGWMVAIGSSDLFGFSRETKFFAAVQCAIIFLLMDLRLEIRRATWNR